MEQKSNAGDSNRITREYFDSLLVEPRYLDAVLPSTTLTLYGETFDTPVMTAALSHLHNAHPEGMVEFARGAAAAGAVAWAGMGSEAELEGMVGTGARVIKIIKPYADDDLIQRKLEHAQRCGAFAVGMDIDHAFNRRGECDNIDGFPMAPKTRGDIERYVKATSLPFIIKGVLSLRDTERYLEAGVSGIVLSHHHGIMDYAVPPLMALPAIRDLVRGRIPIFVDCGVDRGMDAFKALALGATAVSAGRVLMAPLKAGGAPEVAKVIGEMTAELRQALAMTASPGICGIDPAVIHRR